MISYRGNPVPSMLAGAHAMPSVPGNIAGVPGYVLLYALLAIAIAVFLQRVYPTYLLLRKGNSDNRSGEADRRLLSGLRTVFGQGCSLRSVSAKDRAGIGHSILFWTFLLFSMEYAYLFLWGAWHGPLSISDFGNGLAATFSWALDISAALTLGAVVWALCRRYFTRPARLERGRAPAFILGLIFVLIATHFLGEALNLSISSDAFAGLVWPLGDILAGADKNGLTFAYWAVWWIHIASLLGFIAYIPYSKHLHIVASPANVLLQSRSPFGALTPIDGQIAAAARDDNARGFTQRQLLSLSACARCGRCIENCPANIAGKPLFPRDLIESLKDSLLGRGGAASEMGHAIQGTDNVASIWDCTTCGACQQVCPVMIPHVSLFVGMRRQMVECGKVSAGVRNTLQDIRVLGNPWREPQTARSTFLEQLALPVVEQGGQLDLLYWVGCVSTHDDRARSIARAVASLLRKAGLKYAVLGEAERCCGDPARRLGEEGLFQMVARSNIAAIRRSGARRILVHCPHCYNTLKNEYGPLGLQAEVVHHSELIADLVRSGRMKLESRAGQRVTLHDPCYLGRYNGIYDAPRQVLHAIRGTEFVEMRSNRESSFCCGAGGGHLWLPDSGGRRLENLRLEQAESVHPQVIATACPYCTTTLDAAATSKAAGSIRVMDISEIVGESEVFN